MSLFSDYIFKNRSFRILEQLRACNLSCTKIKFKNTEADLLQSLFCDKFIVTTLVEILHAFMEN
jgi:hypothetical protein